MRGFFPILDVKKYLRLPVFFFRGNRVQMALSVLKVADPCSRVTTLIILLLQIDNTYDRMFFLSIMCWKTNSFASIYLSWQEEEDKEEKTSIKKIYGRNI